MTCKKCLHYEKCLERFRKAKEEGLYECTDETEYFSHAGDCDMYITDDGKISEAVLKVLKELQHFALNSSHEYFTFRKIEMLIEEWEKVDGSQEM